MAQVVQKSDLAGGIRRLESLRSQEPRALLALGQAYETQGNSALAEARYREAAERDPAFIAAWRSLGELRRDSGALERARAIAPQDPGVLHALGLAYREVGRAAEAVGALEQAIANDGDFPAAYNALAGLYAGMGDQPKAEAALREALRHQPDYAEAQENLGRLLAADSPAEAEFHLREAIRWKRTGAWRTLGELQAARGQWRLAAESFRTALRAQPKEGAAWLGLGMAQAALNDYPGARLSLRKAAEEGDIAVRKEAEELLRELP